MGMLPKNTLRKQMVAQHLTIFHEPWHTYSNILPQFTEPLPDDINDDLGFNDITPENTIIQYA